MQPFAYTSGIQIWTIFWYEVNMKLVLAMARMLNFYFKNRPFGFKESFFGMKFVVIFAEIIKTFL